MAHETSGYWHAIEVLPFELVDKISEILKVSTKITFAPSHRPYNRSEGLLPAKLVDKCRNELDKRDITTRRIILFGSNKAHDGGKLHARVLADLGFPYKVIADALNYHTVTLRRWGIKDYIRDTPGASVAVANVQATKETLDLGFRRCQSLHPGKTFAADYYQTVGSAMLALQTTDFKKRLAAHMKKERAAGGGSKRWA